MHAIFRSAHIYVCVEKERDIRTKIGVASIKEKMRENRLR